MAVQYSEVPPSIATYFNEEQPLGPVLAENVSDRAVASYLLNLENSACLELASGASILLGRKGAGKSTLLKSFTSLSYVRSTTALSIVQRRTSPSVLKGGDYTRDYAIVVNVEFWKIARDVHKRLMSETLQTPEIAKDLWDEALWQLVLWEVIRRPDILSELEQKLVERIEALGHVLSDFFSEDFKPSDFRSWVLNGNLDFERVELLARALKGQFKKNALEVLFLIDSMEEYEDNDPTLKKCIGGLLQLVATSTPQIKFKVAFPAEIYDSVESESNIEKYFLKTARLRWRPIELIDIATSRMLLCLYLFENEFCGEVIKKHKNDGSARDALIRFWNDIFVTNVQNEAMQDESGIYFLLRHTQMIPRQFINSVSNLVKMSRAELRNYQHIHHDVIAECMRESCVTLVGGVASGFKNVYPDAKTVFEMFFQGCEIVSTGGELHRTFNRSGIKSSESEYRTDYHRFMRAMLHMGAIGIVQGETERYVEADFGYFDENIPNFSESSRIAIHPAFSLTYCSIDTRANAGKAVLPRGSLKDLV